MSKVVITKGLDIGEVVEKVEIQRARAERETVAKTRREEFLDSIRYTKTLSEEEKRQIDKKVANYSERKDAEAAEARRRAEYAHIVSRQLEEGR